MDIFKFNSNFERGSLIQNIDSVMWVERYLDAGEFEIIAPVSSNLRNILPTGSFISHIDTTEVMVVENHEIVEESDSDTKIKITGRSFEALLEERIIGVLNQVWDSNGGEVSVYSLTSAYVWDQAKALIDAHILPSNLTNNPNNALPYVSCFIDSSVSFVTGDPAAEARPLKKQTLYKAVYEILNLAKLGIKSMRPGAWSVLPTDKMTHLGLIIHRGIDKTKSVTFSTSSGEIVRPEYFWSKRTSKNAVLVHGKWLETFVSTGGANYDRQIATLDASDLDEAYTAAPSGATRTNIISQMQIRGRQFLASQNATAISKLEISKNATRYKYRQDYNIGDIVSIEGSYSTSSVRRVVEYVEIQDETGETNYPTLAEI